MNAHPDMALLVQPARVHRALYTDPALFDLEMTRVFAASWNYVAHDSQIREPGEFVTTTVGRRSVIVGRHPDGGVAAVLNRCTHRGTELVVAPSGCAKRYTCPYHGWSFAVDGRLLAVPFPDDHGGNADGDLDLGRLTTSVYRGFVFATLAADPVPLEEWLGPAADAFDQIVDRHPGGRLHVAATPQRLEFSGNWKLSWDNAADGIHATFAHRSYNHLGRDADVGSILDRDPGTTPMTARGTPFGHMIVDQRPAMTRGPWATMRPVPFGDDLVGDLDALESIDPVDGSRPDGVRPPRRWADLATGGMLNLSLFPNLIFVGNQLMVVEPVAVDRTRLVLHLTMADDDVPDAVNLLRLRSEEDFVSFGTPDDLDMFERVQRGLSIPEVEWLDVSRGLADQVDDEGVVCGAITSESPQRAYLRHYASLMSVAPRTSIRTKRDVHVRETR
jgi:phenylpropionate dioxygenase-like ring-hydroxylating dioxygenase large terminal subunit